AWFGCVWAKIKKFRKPAFLPGLKPREECGKFCDKLREKREKENLYLGVRNIHHNPAAVKRTVT
ncbi:hypothetical protein, partial [uncultured Duodenibacillus sp.]